MTKAAKTITYAAGIFTAFWLIIAFLITSVEAVAYWTPGYYEKEYTKYQVLNDLPEMTMDDLLDVTDQLSFAESGRTFIYTRPWAGNTGNSLMTGRSRTWRMYRDSLSAVCGSAGSGS